jgi:dinuclear metal center YbgI/SA1388 family protein
MLDIYKINDFLKNILDPGNMKDVALNGIQVECEPEIKKIAFAVDGSLSSIEKAISEKSQLLIVHHGFFWGRPESITGNHFIRIKKMVENNIGLIAYHLPLDANNEYGNNIGIARKINGENVIPFGDYHGFPIGFQCGLNSLKIEAICKMLDISINEKTVRYLPFGKKEIKTAGIVSGGGSSCFTEAVEKKLDLFITGDADHTLYHQAYESNMNVLFAGHYFTETFGVQLLQKLLEKEFGVQTVFCDIPTGL